MFTKTQNIMWCYGRGGISIYNTTLKKLKNMSHWTLSDWKEWWFWRQLKTLSCGIIGLLVGWSNVQLVQHNCCFAWLLIYCLVVYHCMTGWLCLHGAGATHTKLLISKSSYYMLLALVCNKRSLWVSILVGILFWAFVGNLHQTMLAGAACLL